MASVVAPKNTLGVAPPTTHEALVSFSRDFSRTMPGRKSTKTLEDGMPPAPPPSPVSFAVDSNGKAPSSKRGKIPSLSLE